MSFGAIIGDRQIEPPGVARFSGRPALADIFKQTLEVDESLLGLQLSSQFRNEIERRNEKVREITGENLGRNPFFGSFTEALTDLGRAPDGTIASPIDFFSTLKNKFSDPFGTRNEILAEQERKLEILREKFPELADVETFDSIKDRIVSAEEEDRDRLQVLMTSRPGLAATATSISGSLVSGIKDPVNLAATIATLPLSGPVRGAGVLRNALTVAGREAAINAGIEIGQQPLVSSNARTLGMQFGLTEAATNVLFAAAGGAVLGGGIEALSSSVRALRAKRSENNLIDAMDAELAFAEKELFNAEINPFISQNTRRAQPNIKQDLLDTASLRLSRLHTTATNGAMATLANGKTLTRDSLPFSSDIDFQARVSGYDEKINIALNQRESIGIEDIVERIDLESGQRLKAIREDLEDLQLTRKDKESLFKEREMIIQGFEDADLRKLNIDNELKREIRSLRASRKAEKARLKQEQKNLAEITGQKRIFETDNPFEDFDPIARKVTRDARTRIEPDAEAPPEKLRETGFVDESAPEGNEMLAVFQRMNREENITAEIDDFLNSLDDVDSFEIGGEIVTGRQIKEIITDNKNELEAVRTCGL